jgi:acylphosphatase
MDEARRLSLAGWMRNRVDGSVEVLAEGVPAKLDLFLAYLKRGPWGARVESVAVDWDDARGAPMPFQLKRTE